MQAKSTTPGCPFHRALNTLNEIFKINNADKCPVKNSTANYKNRTVESLNEAERKQEYYLLLFKFLPSIVDITKKLRKDFPLGLVKLKDKNLPGSYQNITSAIDEEFTTKINTAASQNDFLMCSYLVHNAIGVTIDIATEIWAGKVNWNKADLKRLLELVDAHRQQLYGTKAAQKRISSAMLQTLHISASCEKFIYLAFAAGHSKNYPSQAEMLSLHHKTIKTALCLTELHLERTRQIRPVLGAQTEGEGIVHRYLDSSHFFLSNERLELKEDSLSVAMLPRPIETSDGRIGCPGKKHIPDIWCWIEQVSKKYSYSVLTPSSTSCM